MIGKNYSIDHRKNILIDDFSSYQIKLFVSGSLPRLTARCLRPGVAVSTGLRWRIEPASGGEFTGPRKQLNTLRIQQGKCIVVEVALRPSRLLERNPVRSKSGN